MDIEKSEVKHEPNVGTAYDAMAGEDSDFLIHLNGCRHLQKINIENNFDHEGRQIHSLCQFLTLLARTTSCEFPGQDLQMNQLVVEEPYFNDNDKHIEYIHGVTPKLGNLLQRTCRIAEYIASSGEHDVPRLVSEACRTLEIDILAWELDSEYFHLGGCGTSMIEIARCQAKAFYSAVLLFFSRTIGMSYPLDLDHEVSIILGNLTLAESLKDQNMQCQMRNAPMTWPAFIGACEATVRQPWAEWWTRVQDYRVGNFKRQWMVIQEIWGILDEDKKVINWREALWKSGKLVLPI